MLRCDCGLIVKNAGTLNFANFFVWPRRFVAGCHERVAWQRSSPWWLPWLSAARLLPRMWRRHPNSQTLIRWMGNFSLWLIAKTECLCVSVCGCICTCVPMSACLFIVFCPLEYFHRQAPQDSDRSSYEKWVLALWQRFELHMIKISTSHEKRTTPTVRNIGITLQRQEIFRNGLQQHKL